MQSLNDGLWSERARRLGLDRLDVLARAQRLLDRRFPGKGRAHSLNHGVLRIVTTSSGVASELRLQQVAILGELTDETTPITKLVITIGQLESLVDPDA